MSRTQGVDDPTRGRVELRAEAETEPGVKPEIEPEVEAILIDHALLGTRIQMVMRVILAVFLILVIALDPPAMAVAATWVVVGAYAAWVVGSALVVARSGRRAVRWVWLALFVDLAAVTTVAVLASRSDETSWTTDVLMTGFALIPMAAATSLRPAVCAAVALPTTVVFFVASALARSANSEPWSSVLLHTLVIAGLGLGAVLLSRLGRSRVATIAELARHRAALLADILEVERRARRDLAVTLHDGALQYVLAARGDVAAARLGDPAAGDRLDYALGRSGELLRTVLTSLNPAVLEHHGLAVAVGELTASMSTASGLRVNLDTATWPDGPTAVDELLYLSARELLRNVVAHAQADRVEVTLELDDGWARVVVVDDGVGYDADSVAPERLTERLAAGHIGLASRQVRLAAAGGRLSLAPRAGGGTVAIASVPMTGESRPRLP